MSSEFATKALKDMAEAAEAAQDPEKQAAFEAEMKQQEERRKRVDDLCMQTMEVVYADVQEMQHLFTEYRLCVEDVTALTNALANLCGAMAQMRLNMSYGVWPAPGCGYNA